jgi:hypothetical protein
MGIVAGELGDHKREEKFYREAGSLARWGGPWFNLALAQLRLGKIAEAIDSTNRALLAERRAPYLVLRAMLAEKVENESERGEALKEAISSFNPISAQSDWELGWYVTAVRMLGEERALLDAEAELKRRARSGTRERNDEGHLPIRASRD